MRAVYRTLGFTVSLSFFLSCAASGVQLWPDVSVELSAEDQAVERGASISDDSGCKAELVLDFDQISAALYGGRWRDDERLDVESVIGYRLSYEIGEGATMLCAGLDGVMFGSDATAAALERHELFLSLARYMRCLAGSRFSCNLYADIDNDFILYTSVGLDRTVPFVKWMDADVSLTAGLGDDRFAANQLARMGGAIEVPRYWSDLSCMVAFPVMLGDVDIVPSISHSWVLDSDLRDAVDAAGKDADVWQFALAVKLYFE